MAVESDLPFSVSSLRPLHELTQAVAGAIDLTGIYDAALKCLRACLGVEKASILLYDPDGVMRFKAWVGLSDTYREAVEGHTPWTHDTTNAQPLLVPDVFADPSLAEYKTAFEAESIVGLAFIPLIASGSLLGKFMLYYPAEHHFADDEVLLSQTIASQVAFAIHARNSQLELQHRQGQYQELVESLGLAVYTTDAEGEVVLYNEAATRLWGRPPEPGDLWWGSWKITTPDGSPMPFHECPMAIALREERAVRGVEIVIEKPDGSRASVLPYPTPLRNRDGVLTGAVNVLVDITELRAAEAALRESEERFRLAAQASRLGAWEWDLGERVVWTETLEEIYGYEPGQFPGTLEAFGERLHPDDRTRVFQIITEAVRDGTPVDFEERIVLPTGAIRWLHSRAQLVRNPSGEATRLTGICMDVTESKLAEQAREDALARLSEQTDTLQTVQAVGETVARELDLTRAVQAVTDAATKLTQAEFGAFFYHVTDEHGEKFMLYALSGADPVSFEGFPLPGTTPLFAPTFRGEGPIRLEDVHADPRYGREGPHFGMPEGHLPVSSYLAVPVVARSGEVLGGLFFGHSAPRKFTEQHERMAEGIACWGALAIENARLYEASQKANQAISESEARYRNIFSSAGVPVWEEDFTAVKRRVDELQSQGVGDLRQFLQLHPDAIEELIDLVRVIDVNDEALLAIGARDKTEATGSLSRIFTPETRERFIEEIVLLATGGRSISLETTIRTLRGELRDILFTLVFVNAPEKYDQALVTWTDITARKRAEDELREAAALKDQFIGLISHELRTPISTVIANGNVLARKGDLLGDEDRQQALEDIVSEGARLQTIIENLLLLSRLESTAVEFESMDLEELVEGVVESFTRRRPDRTVIFERSVNARVDGQAGLLRLAIDNLVGNADKYSPSEGPIEVRLETTSDGQIEVHVLDEGIGVPDEGLAGLFTPFYRTENAKAYAPGMGLGLAVSKRIVEAHNGRVWIKPRPNGGSDFAIRLRANQRSREGSTSSTP